jgi:DNA-binding NtrC family response regulator
MEARSTWILCVADSNTRLNHIARAVRRAGYNVSMTSSAHKAVALAAITSHLEAVVLDEDLIVAEESVAESIKAVKPLPVLVVCDNGPSGALPTGVDLVTANGSRQQIVAGVEKLLKAFAASAHLAS